jgi:N utilization substance protein A
MPSPIRQAIQQICDEKNIPYEVVLETIEAALAAAYRKDYGEKNQNVKVEFDPDTMRIRAFDVKEVVEDQELPSEEELEAMRLKEEGERKRARADGREYAPEPELDENGEPIKRFNPKTMIMLAEAQKAKPDAQLGDTLRMELSVPGEFGRMAAQTAKQVIIQKLREAERETVFNEYRGREGEIVTAIVQRREGRAVLVDLGRAAAIMPPEEQIHTEAYAPGQRLKVYIAAVNMTSRGPAVVVSRSHPDIVRRLFATEIPEVSSGAVVIHKVSREAGSRSKVAVSSDDPNIDPIGSCIGQRGTRIQTIIHELGGEKVDVIQYDEDPAAYVSNALSPAKVSSVELDEETKTATVFAPGDQLSLAIGKGGQNVRLASKLTGWKINVHEEGGGERTTEDREQTTEDREQTTEDGEQRSEL